MEHTKADEDCVRRGVQFRWSGGLAKIMVVADGWVMARMPRCMPFTLTVKEVIPKLHLPDEARPQ